MAGKVWLVGAGPGDRGLFTLKGLEVLQNAEVVVYDALVGDEVLTLIPEQAESIDVGKRAGHHRMPQEQINRTLLERALAGRRVVRLKGGDPFLFGRGGEELELLAENNIPCEVVPGVSSAFAVPAYNGIPVTHRDFTSSVHIITGHRRAFRGAENTGGAGSFVAADGSAGTEHLNDCDGSGIDFAALVRTRGTLIFLMGVSALPMIMKGLLDAGIDSDTPAAVLEKGTTAGQRRVLATVSTLEPEAARARVQAPAVIVVGKVCRLAKNFAWAEKRPLAGRKILLTRPKGCSPEMAVRLRGEGAEVLELPAIETVQIEPNPALDKCLDLYFGNRPDRHPEAGSDKRPDRHPAADPDKRPDRYPAACFDKRLDACRDKAPETDAYSGRFGQILRAKPADCIDWMIFTSPTGVRVFMDRFLEDHDIRALAGIRFAVIGEGSAKRLRQYGIRPDFIPSVYDGETLGRELARKIRQERAGRAIPRANAGEVEESQGAGGSAPERFAAETAAEEKLPARILIPRAAIGGRELIAELEKAGNVDISDIPMYNTEYVTSGIVDLRTQIESGEIDYAVFTSASTVRGFGAAMRGADLSRIRAICIGCRTRAAADARGMETRMAERATLDALVDAVLQCAAENRTEQDAAMPAQLKI